MRERWAACSTEDVKIKWVTVDHCPEYGEWKRWRPAGRRPANFHLTRMVRSSAGAEQAILLLKTALNYYAADHAFMYQTTWPVVWDREFRVVKRQGLEVSVIEEDDWLVATTLVFPGFKQDVREYMNPIEDMDL